ncbi:hypothetical protein LWI29_021326 [Acer saccharum]|uniref:Zinc knuckle CX2CX4HX4C domain-containing protein n=1 Tax=Acer saccharum TaxID=4024 RepID=A0AA39S7V8_ACESA|nr:hypothetical protein LWI29_021326 [Acer saccharum]
MSNSRGRSRSPCNEDAYCGVSSSDLVDANVDGGEIHKSSTPVSTKDGLLAEIHKRPNGSSKIGLKSGKWKRLAHDGVRMDSGLEAEVQMGKRGLVLENDSEKQEVKFAKVNDRFIKLNVEDSGRPVVVPLTYERLPEFCYAYGRIGHELRECLDDEARTEALEGSSTRFGSWMRAAVGERTKVNQQRQWGKNSSDSSENKSLSLSDGPFQKVGGSKPDPFQKQALERSVGGETAGTMTDRMGVETRPEKELIESGYEDSTNLVDHIQGFGSSLGEKRQQEKGKPEQVEHSASISAMEGVVVYSGNSDTRELKETCREK